MLEVLEPARARFELVLRETHGVTELPRFSLEQLVGKVRTLSALEAFLTQSSRRSSSIGNFEGLARRQYRAVMKENAYLSLVKRTFSLGETLNQRAFDDDIMALPHQSAASTNSNNELLALQLHRDLHTLRLREWIFSRLCFLYHRDLTLLHYLRGSPDSRYVARGPDDVQAIHTDQSSSSSVFSALCGCPLCSLWDELGAPGLVYPTPGARSATMVVYTSRTSDAPPSCHLWRTNEGRVIMTAMLCFRLQRIHWCVFRLFSSFPSSSISCGTSKVRLGWSTHAGSAPRRAFCYPRQSWSSHVSRLRLRSGLQEHQRAPLVLKSRFGKKMNR